MSEMFKKFLEWVNKQVAHGKTAWGLFVLVAGLLGYEVSCTQKGTPTDPPPSNVPVDTNPKIPVDD